MSRSRLAVVQPQNPLAAGKAETVVFLCCETTGIGSTDRPVSFAAVKLSLKPPGEIVWLHLVFDPQRVSSPSSARLHGYTAEELARQDDFAAYARPLRQWLEGADLLVAGDALELRLLGDAFRRAELPDLDAPAAFARGDLWTAASRRESVVERLRFVRNPRHGALARAWGRMQAYLREQGLPWRLDYALCGDKAPANFRADPARACPHCGKPFDIPPSHR